MGWKTFHNRGETLRAVVDLVNERRDGRLPLDEPGVAENFADELDLVGALLLKWHARLSGNTERALVREPLDLEAAVATAWRTTAEQMPGVRRVIDRCTDEPHDDAMAHAMTRAREHEWTRLAMAAGLASGGGPAALVAGRRVEELAREGLVEAPVALEAEAPSDDSSGTPSAPQPQVSTRTASFVDRIRAVLAA